MTYLIKLLLIVRNAVMKLIVNVTSQKTSDSQDNKKSNSGFTTSVCKTTLDFDCTQDVKESPEKFQPNNIMSMLPHPSDHICWKDYTGILLKLQNYSIHGKMKGCLMMFMHK